jgi:hypothetical protein
MAHAARVAEQARAMREGPILETGEEHHANS